MDIGTFILRRLIGPVVRRTMPAVRNARARLARGRCFRLPRGKTYVLIPEMLDYESATVITEMLDHFWFQKGRDWEVVRIGAGAALTDAMRRANLVILGRPDQNPATRELMRDHPELLQSVRYHDGASPEFRWQDTAFRAGDDHDFGLVCVKRNVLTSDTRRRLVLIFGLRDRGTLAAARLYADRQYTPDRRTLQRETGTLQGDLEALLHVSHSPDGGQIHRVRPARRRDGAATQGGGPEQNQFLTPFRGALARIYDSLQQHRRRLVVSRLGFTLTVTRDFGLRIEEEATMGAESQDVVVMTKALRGTPLAADEDISFATQVIGGDDDQAYLPAEVLKSERRFLIFPLPPLIVGSPPRRIRISALWPRACQTLQQHGGEDVNSVEVSDNAGPDVDLVSITIRFEVQDAAFSVFERFSLENAVPGPGGKLPRGQTYDIHSPYHLQLRDVPRGTTLEFRIVRMTPREVPR
jgi:hypothetical protein